MQENVAKVEESLRTAVVQQSFLLVSPQYAGKSMSPGERIFVHKVAGKSADISKQIEEVHKKTRVHHNYPAKDVFINIGGIKCLLPFLFELAEWSPSEGISFSLRYYPYPELKYDRDQLVERIISLMEEELLTSAWSSGIFLGRNEGIMILGYLLGRLAARRGLGAGVYAGLKRVFQVFEKHYPAYTEKFTETILYNMDIWKYSPADVQALVIEQIHSFFIMGKPSPQRVAENIDILLNCIEVYANYDDKANEKPIDQLSAIILLLAEEFLTNELLFKLISYANVFYVRRLNNYPAQIYHIMNIFNKICEICKQPRLPSQIGNEKVLLLMRDSIKSKKDSKLLSTIFTIFDFFMNIKEGNRSGYRGILLSKRRSIYHLPSEGFNEKDAADPKQLSLMMKSSLCTAEEARAMHINGTSQGSAQIDGITGICIYWILALDYATIAEGSKEEYKKDQGDIVGLIWKKLVKGPNKLSMGESCEFIFI